MSNVSISDSIIYGYKSGGGFHASSSLTYEERRNLARNGYVVLKNASHPLSIMHAKRLLMLEIVNWGLSKEQIAEWHQTNAWFPTLRFDQRIKDHLSVAIPDEILHSGELCEPQIILQFPDEATSWEYTFHQDKEPDWAEGRKYTWIAGVALTDSHAENGGLVVMPPYAPEGYYGDHVELEAGDIIIFHPELWHRNGLNETGDIRMMVYFRWLEHGRDSSSG